MKYMPAEEIVDQWVRIFTNNLIRWHNKLVLFKQTYLDLNFFHNEKIQSETKFGLELFERVTYLTETAVKPSNST